MYSLRASLFLSQSGRLCILVITCVFLSSTPAWADEFRNPFHDGAAIGQGSAFAAQADNASAIFYNPAGMTQVRGVEFAGGAQFVSVNTTFTSQTGGTVQNDRPFPIGLPPSGQMFLTANPGAILAPRIYSASVTFVSAICKT